MLCLTLALALAQSPSEVIEDAFTKVDRLRELARVRGGVSLQAGAFTLVVGTTPRVAPTLGLSGELGLKFSDRLAAIGRLSVIANVINLNLGAAALLEYALSERFAFAVGPSLHFFFGLGVSRSLIATLPIRVTFALSGREPNQIAGRGFLLGIELAQGVVFFSSMERGRDFSPIPTPSFWASGQLTVSYAWW
jgi:hypothetical protein